MASRKELTITQTTELEWDDGQYDDSTEKYLIEDFQLGWKRLTVELKHRGHTDIYFNEKLLDI